jgi:hypothetical protein
MVKQYVIFLHHIEACNFTEDEWNNLFWAIDEEPNSSDDGIHINYYDFTMGFDPMDSGLIDGYTTEKYFLDIYDDKALELYPSVAKLLAQEPPLYDKEKEKRHMTEEEINNEIQRGYDEFRKLRESAIKHQ